MADTRRFLIVVQLHVRSDIKRVARDAPGVLSTIKSVAVGQPELVFRSNDGQLFGFFIESQLVAPQIKGALDSSESTLNDDAALVMELGQDPDSAELGFKRPWGWLLRTRAPRAAAARDAPTSRP